MKIRMLSGDEVARSLSMPKAIELMRSAFTQLTAGKAQVPQRHRLDTPCGTTLVMPAFLEQSNDLCVKIVSSFDGNPERGLPAIPAVVFVLDPETGMPRTIMDGHSLTLLRTAAAGGLATELLSRADARNVAIIGAGDQAPVQLQAVMAVREVEHVFIKSRTRASADRLAAKIAEWPNAPRVTVVDAASEAVAQADVVVTVTNSTEPVVDFADLRPGTHITAIGSFKPTMRELDTETVRRARVVVDSRSAALVEAGDLIAAGLKPEDVSEIGEIVRGDVVGRQNEEQLTLFKSVGVAAQDAAAGCYVADRAEELGLGTMIRL